MSRDFVVVVSGVPRSGTSLLMQMLGAGGLPLLCDDARPADAHNPRGYFELAAVAATRRDASWLARASGHAVKVVSPILFDLPEGTRYRIVWIQRAFAEVFASQRAMLGAAGEGGEAEWCARWERESERARRWAAEASSAALLRIEHAELLSDPARVVAEIDRFLGSGLDRAAMIRALDPSLHRQR